MFSGSDIRLPYQIAVGLPMLTAVRLRPFTAAFFVGRLVSYSIYAVPAQKITSPLGIALQLAMVVFLVVLSQIDWEKRLHPFPALEHPVPIDRRQDGKGQDHSDSHFPFAMANV